LAGTAGSGVDAGETPAVPSINLEDVGETVEIGPGDTRGCHRI
jgi:hypothetical protein